MAEITVQVDPHVKKQAIKVLENEGLDLASGIRLFLQEVVRMQGIPFEVSLQKSRYQRAMADMENGRMESFENVDELFKDLGI